MDGALGGSDPRGISSGDAPQSAPGGRRHRSWVKRSETDSLQHSSLKWLSKQPLRAYLQPQRQTNLRVLSHSNFKRIM